MFRSGGNEVNPGGFNAGVPQHIGQFHHIPAHLVKGPGEKMSQVMGEYFGGFYARRLAQAFHFSPNLPSGQASSASGEENLTGGDFLCPGVLFQLPA